MHVQSSKFKFNFKCKFYFTVSYPSTWKNTTDGKLANTLHLDANDLEYIQIKKDFEATVCVKSIFSIARIQNPTLYNHYAVRKRFLDESNPPETKNERWLYHGCKETDEQYICSHGFGWKDITIVIRPDVIAPIMKPYGEGICFTVKATSSAHPIYSPADSRGHRRMFLARVLTGEYTLGSAGLKKPPQKDSSKTLYDSVVDNMNSPEVFVVFSNAQCYPEYLITYK